MKNMLYYLKHYGNMSFADFPINEVDSLILCQISYLNLDQYVPSGAPIFLSNIFKEEHVETLIMNTFSKKMNRKMISLLRQSVRFLEFKVGYLKNYFSYDECEQFYALTFFLHDISYIVFRGTDLTILGWKENFNMAYLKEIPSQRDAVRYVNEIFMHHKTKIYIAGHSKGGNLAMYSALNCQKEIRDFIVQIYNFDGPGLYSDVYLDEDFLLIKNKLITMTTQQAMIAVLLYYVDNLIFIKSRGFYFLQHVPFNWKVNKKGALYRIKKNALQSRWFAKSIRIFFEDTSELERKRFVDLIFTIVEAGPGNSVNDIRYRPFTFLSKSRRRYKKLDKEDRKFFMQMVKKMRKSFSHTLKTKLLKKIYKKQ